MYALLAVVEVLQEMEGNEIEIVRAAGTSAGAIAAAFLATETQVAPVVKGLRETEKGRLLVEPLVMPEGWGAFFKAVVWGRPLLSMDSIRKWLEEDLIAGDPRLRTVGDVKKDLVIVRTDLLTREAKEAGKSDSLVDAICDSCSIPMVFSTWKSAGNFVDGGLVDNLPANYLKAGDGVKTIAISFFPRHPRRPNSFGTFLGAVVDAAISSSERKAKELVGGLNVFEALSKFETFEFKRALTEGLGDPYHIIKLEFKSWISNFLATTRKGGKVTPPDFWRSSDPLVRDIMKKVGRSYASGEEKVLINIELFRVTIQANCLRGAGDALGMLNDDICVEVDFSAAKEPIRCIAVMLSGANVDSEFARDMAYVAVTGPNKEQVNFELIPALVREDGGALRQVLISFHEPIRPGTGTYHLLFKEEAQNYMGDLLTKGLEPLTANLLRAAGPVNRVEFILGAPAPLRDALIFEPVDGRRPGAMLDVDAVRSGSDLLFQGRYGENIPPARDGNDAWGYNVRLISR